MKYGYACECGWRLGRTGLTRREYAADKIKHAEDCEPLRKELAQSQKAGAGAAK